MTAPAYTVGRYGSTWISDEHGERRIPPGEADPYGKPTAGPSIRAAPRLEAGPLRDAQVVAVTLHFALDAVAERLERGQRCFPATVRFRRGAGMIVCAVLTRGGVLGCGAYDAGTLEGGTWDAKPEFEQELRLELEKARGAWSDELDETTGLPAVT